MMTQIGAVRIDPARARVYAEGWQSWSQTRSFPATAAPLPVTSPESLAIDCQYGQAAQAGMFQGSGLLAVDPAGRGPVTVFGAREASSRVPVIQARLHGEELIVCADTPVTASQDGGPGGIPGALGRWADRFATGLALREIPPAWCSWYQYYSGVTQADVLANLAAMDALRIPVGVVQVDDGYESCPGDWLTASGRFPDLPGLIATIRHTGRRAGIWIAPMLVGRSSKLFASHPGWVVRDPGTGEPVYAGAVCRDSCAALDLTHPDAAGYLAGVLGTMRGWGVSYFKIDFCYAGAVEGSRYAAMTGVEAYRHGLRLIRDAIGPDALLVGCGAPILPSVGLVDAMRVGPDIAADYEPPGGQPTMPSQRNAARNVIARAWQHGRFWVNDPDCLMLRPEVQRRSEWASVVEHYGGLRCCGDGLRQLDDWGLATMRRLLVDSPVKPVTLTPLIKEEPGSHSPASPWPAAWTAPS
jgi:alpha-galactosidase